LDDREVCSRGERVLLESDCIPTAYEEFDSLAFKLKQRGLDAHLRLNEPIHLGNRELAQKHSQAVIWCGNNCKTLSYARRHLGTVAALDGGAHNSW
jgi:hypothetical protein